MLNSLIVVNFIIPLLGMVVFCVNKKGLKIDHVFLFSAGFLYFWIMPLMIYKLKIYEIYSMMLFAIHGKYLIDEIGLLLSIITEKAFSDNFSVENYVVSDDKYIKYLILLFCIYAAFIIGELISSKIKYKTHRVSSFSLKPLDVILYIYLGILILMAVFSYNYYFKGFAQIITLTNFTQKAHHH